MTTKINAPKSRTRIPPARGKVPAKNKNVRLAIACTPDERKLMKMLASYEDKTLNDFVMDCVRERMSECKLSHIPNAETAKALHESEKGKGLKKYKTIDEMFEYLGI